MILSKITAKVYVDSVSGAEVYLDLKKGKAVPEKWLESYRDQLEIVGAIDAKDAPKKQTSQPGGKADGTR